MTSALRESLQRLIDRWTADEGMREQCAIELKAALATPDAGEVHFSHRCDQCGNVDHFRVGEFVNSAMAATQLRAAIREVPHD